MAGQSNMEGCGYVREALPPDSRVWCFDLQNRWREARDPMHDLIHSAAAVDLALRKAMAPAEVIAAGDDAVRVYWEQRNANVGAGLGIAFGAAYADATGRPVGLISAAHGGTTMEDWNPARRGEGWNSLYGALLERIRLAGGQLAGILWYQGESDANPEAAPTYGQRFAQWVEAVRRDTGRPDLPIVTVQLGGVHGLDNSVEGWNQIRRTQLALPLEIPNLAVAPTIDFTHNDSIHLDAHSLARLGRRMARLALALTGNGGSAEIPRVTTAAARLNDREMGETDLTFTGVTGAFHPERGMHGFVLLKADGTPDPENLVTAAFPHPCQPGAIVVRTLTVPRPGSQIAYGYGLAPICNVTDDSDMALPAFVVAIQ